MPVSALTPRQHAVEHHEIPQGLPPDNATTHFTASPFLSAESTSGRWETFARHQSDNEAAAPSADTQQSSRYPAPRQTVHRRQSCSSPSSLESGDKAAYLPLSRTTDRVLRLLLEGDLSRVRAESVAETLGVSCTTLRRRLRNDHTSYQFLLDRARQYRCESRLRERWLPGKCLADELGYLEVNSFYRAFRRWTGLSYSDYRQMYH